MNAYPVAEWEGWTLTFFPHPAEFRDPAVYSLCLCLHGQGFVVVNIPGRGWVTPSGRIEPRESSADAARREAREEAGVELGDLHRIGYYQLERGLEFRSADVWVGEVTETGGSAEGEVRVVTLEELPALYAGWNTLFERLFSESRDCLSRGSATPPAW